VICRRRPERGLALALLLAGCGAAPASEPTTAGVEAVKPAAPPLGEGADCRAERLAITDAIAASQAKSCAADADCATATNPGSFVKELDVVVNAADREAIDERSRAHLDRCGTFYHYTPIEAIRVVEARCVDGRCAEQETVLHVEE
jgi:hypothetical protein